MADRFALNEQDDPNLTVGNHERLKGKFSELLLVGASFSRDNKNLNTVFGDVFPVVLQIVKKSLAPLRWCGGCYLYFLF